MSTNCELSLSLVITSYTTERLNDIYELLDSIKQQTYQNMETIFVVERSEELRDKLNAFIDEMHIKNSSVFFSLEKLGMSPARNVGVKNAKGDIIAFVDDDVVLFPDWAEKMVKSYTDENIIGVTGSALPLWEDNSLQWLPEELYWIVSCTAFLQLNEIKPVRCAGGMNMSFRKEAFQHCLFSDKFGHIGKERSKVGPVVDDAEFSINLRQRSGKQIIFNPNIKVWHRVYAYRLKKKFIRGQCYWQGYSKALLKRTYTDDLDMHGLLRERALLNRIFFKLGPRTIALLFRHPKQAMKIFILTITVLFYVALGYSANTIPWLTGYTKKYFRS